MPVGTGSQRTDLQPPQHRTGARQDGGGRPTPKINDPIDTPSDDVQGGFGWLHHRSDRGASQADATTQFAPVAPTERFPKDGDPSRRRGEIARQCRQERRLPGTIRAEEHPVLARAHGPINALEDDLPLAGDAQASDLEDRRERRLHGLTLLGRARSDFQVAKRARPSLPSAPRSVYD